MKSPNPARKATSPLTVAKFVQSETLRFKRKLGNSGESRLAVRLPEYA